MPAWFVDTDYNGLCFHVSQAFFPRTGAWNDLRKALKGDYDESVWDHLAGRTSAPFEAGQHRQVAVRMKRFASGKSCAKLAPPRGPRNES